MAEKFSIEEREKSIELLDKLKSLELPPEDFAIFGGGPLYPIGVKPLGHDIDLVARGAAWEKARSLGNIKMAEEGNLMIALFNDEIEIFNEWIPGKWDIDELIDTADVYDGIRFVNLQNVIKYKRERGRPKDLEHLRMLEDYLTDKEP